MKKTRISNCGIVSSEEEVNTPVNKLVNCNYFNQSYFKIKRVYFLYKNNPSMKRGNHAHKNLYQIIVAINGSFDITIHDGFEKKSYTLNHRSIGLKLVPGIWRELSNFSKDSVCLVLASELYDTKDYIHDWNEFINYKT